MASMIISPRQKITRKKSSTLTPVYPFSKTEDVTFYFNIEPYFSIQALNDAKKDEQSNLSIAKICIDRKAPNTPFKL